MKNKENPAEVGEDWGSGRGGRSSLAKLNGMKVLFFKDAERDEKEERFFSRAMGVRRRRESSRKDRHTRVGG